MQSVVKFNKKKRFGYSTREKKKFPFVYIILILPVAQIALFFFYVNFSTVALAFQDQNGNWSLESFQRVFTAFYTGKDAVTGMNLREMVLKSVILWLTANGAGFFISILTSFILTKHMIGSRFFRLVYYIPGIVGLVVFSSIMKSMYAYNGPVVAICQKIGINLPTAVIRNGFLGSGKTAFGTLVVQSFVLGIAGGHMIMASAFMKIPEEIFESAKLEGCGLFREAFQIAIPCIWPTLTTLLTFSLCSFFTFDQGFYLYSNGTGANGIVNVGYYLYRLQATISENMHATYLYGFASAFGLIITCATIPVVLIGRWGFSKLNDQVAF